MNPQRYKLLMGYLPTVASIVNSFQSQEVQRCVYDSLMEALNARLDTEIEGTTVTNRKASPASTTKSSNRATAGSILLSRNADIEQDLVEGDSIHSMADSDPSLP